jgi:hypothetical protein
MTKRELKILQLERRAAESEDAFHALCRGESGDCRRNGSCQGEVLANLLRNAADARQVAAEMRAQLPPTHPLYRAPPWMAGWEQTHRASSRMLVRRKWP